MRVEVVEPPTAHRVGCLADACALPCLPQRLHPQNDFRVPAPVGVPAQTTAGTLVVDPSLDRVAQELLEELVAVRVPRTKLLALLLALTRSGGVVLSGRRVTGQVSDVARWLLSVKVRRLGRVGRFGGDAQRGIYRRIDVG